MKIKLPIPPSVQLRKNYKIRLNQVRFLKGEANYTLFHLVDNQRVLSAYTLKRFDALLCNSNFIRISRAILVNIDFVKDYRNSIVTLKDGTTLKASRRKRNQISFHTLNTDVR
jgi:DNA-binding LytR/AlgR family response regulator